MPNRDSKIEKRAFAKWEKEGRPEGQDQKHWFEAADEISAEEGSKPNKLLEPNADKTYAAEKLAVETGITGDEAIELIDRYGNDKELLFAAAREIRARGSA